MGVLKRSTRNARWIERYCRVPEGRDVGRALKLRPFQRRILRLIYDNAAGTRTAIVSMGRKNGKTTLLACLLLLHLAGPEARPNAQLYSAAQSRDQAALLYGLAAKMVRLSPDLAGHVRARETAKQLLCPELGTVYRALSAEARTSYGISPTFVVHDELGQVRGPRSELYDALETAVGAHEEPLTVIISTQARRDEDLLSQLIDDAAAGHDPHTVLALWTADPELDPFGAKAMRQACPAYRDFLVAGQVRQLAERARRMPSREAAYRNLILNQRVADKAESWLTAALWRSAQADLDLAGYAGRPCWGGLDLSLTKDLTALVLAFEAGARRWDAFAWHWMPGDRVAEACETDGAPYDAWRREGFLRAPPGPVVDYARVARELAGLCELYRVREIAYDRHKVELLRHELDRIGQRVPLAPHGQGFAKSSETGMWMPGSIEETEAALLEGRLRVARNPLLTWCAGNAVCVPSSLEPADRRFDKRRATGRIDGAVALVQALGAATRLPRGPRKIRFERLAVA